MWLFWFYLFSIFLLSILPINVNQELNHITLLQVRGDYFIHAVSFLPWFFFYRVFRVRQILWLGIGLLFASLAEGVQYLLPYRAFNINDLLANLLGIGAGWLLVLVGKPWLTHFHTN